MGEAPATPERQPRPAVTPAGRGAVPARATCGRRRGANARLVRRLHVWTSMLSLVTMLFFGLSGILLNHENWTLGSHQSERTATGTLPATLKGATGFDSLTIATYVHDHEGLTGRVNGSGTSGQKLWVSYLGPGYSARITADPTTGAYQLIESKQGLVGVIDDIHRAKGTGTVWSWTNDLAGALLAFIGATGLLITWLTRAKNRRRDLALSVVGLLLVGLAWWTAVR